MRIAAIYDVHGNLPALEAVLEDVRKVMPDLIVFGGDVVPGPMPVECIELLMSIETLTKFVRGNGDREVLAQFDGDQTEWVKRAPEAHVEPVKWCAKQLSARHAQAMRSWRETCTIEHSALGNVLFCHATPRNDTEIFTRLTSEERLLPVFQNTNVGTVVCGHTHMQFDRTVGDKRVINAGSVGMPFGDPGAYWLLVGSDVELRYTSYDLTKAAERINTTEYPQVDEFVTSSLLQPRSEDEMLELLESAAVR